ncbi:D-sedoheptulose-7-phosphate isomerase [Calidifontibacter terrae]
MAPTEQMNVGYGPAYDHVLHASDAATASRIVRQQLSEGIADWASLAQGLAAAELADAVGAAGEDLIAALVAGRTLLVAGNGGSAAIASHVAAEFIGKCIHDREPLPAINLAESLSSITAIGNDYGYDKVFSRGVAAHGRAGDVLLAMSTSGTSPNVVAALATARERGMLTIAMTGEGGAALAGSVDHLLVVPSRSTPRIQEVHMLWTHAWCEAVDVLCRPED